MCAIRSAYTEIAEGIPGGDGDRKRREPEFRLGRAERVWGEEQDVVLHSSHDAEGASFLHAALEGGQVVVLQLGKRDLRIEVVPRDNLAVNRRMLE